MELNEGQCERIARWLDGGDIALSAEELAEAQRIRRGEALLGTLLEVPVPPEVSRRVQRAVRRELGRGRRRIVRIVIDVAAIAAAALLIVALLLPSAAPAPPTAVPTAVLFEGAYPDTRSEELDAIAEQMDQVEARLLAALPPMPEEGVAAPAADDEAGRIFDDPWLEELLENLSS